MSLEVMASICGQVCLSRFIHTKMEEVDEHSFLYVVEKPTFGGIAETW